MKPSNIYEADETKLSQELERLSSFDLPNQVSINAIGGIRPGTKFLDIGVGSSTSLGNYINEYGGIYTALDRNQNFLDIQKARGVLAINGDIRAIPFPANSFDIAHARFVIAHLGQDKKKAIQEVFRVTNPGGISMFLDFDWSAAHGSQDFDSFRDFLINAGSLFDADYGADLESDVRSVISTD